MVLIAKTKGVHYAKNSRSGFFPPRGQPFSVLTSDGFPFVCVVAQDGDKAIHTTNNNSEFGEYVRRRLGVPLGAPITLDDLDRFGNRYVKFTKINEEEYYIGQVYSARLIAHLVFRAIYIIDVGICSSLTMGANILLSHQEVTYKQNTKLDILFFLYAFITLSGRSTIALKALPISSNTHDSM